MNYEHSGANTSIVDELRKMNGEAAGFYLLRSYSWPTAALTQAALLIDSGRVPVHIALEASRTMLESNSKKSRQFMYDEIASQLHSYQSVAILDQFHQLVLPNSGIHLVDLNDPFTWNARKAQQRFNLISDLASFALEDQHAQNVFEKLMDIQQENLMQCQADAKTQLLRFTENVWRASYASGLSKKDIFPHDDTAV